MSKRRAQTKPDKKGKKQKVVAGKPESKESVLQLENVRELQAELLKLRRDFKAKEVKTEAALTAAIREWKPTGANRTAFPYPGPIRFHYHDDPKTKVYDLCVECGKTAELDHITKRDNHHRRKCPDGHHWRYCNVHEWRWGVARGRELSFPGRCCCLGHDKDPLEYNVTVDDDGDADE